MCDLFIHKTGGPVTLAHAVTFPGWAQLCSQFLFSLAESPVFLLIPSSPKTPPVPSVPNPLHYLVLKPFHSYRWWQILLLPKPQTGESCLIPFSPLAPCHHSIRSAGFIEINHSLFLGLRGFPVCRNFTLKIRKVLGTQQWFSHTVNFHISWPILSAIFMPFLLVQILLDAHLDHCFGLLMYLDAPSLGSANSLLQTEDRFIFLEALLSRSLSIMALLWPSGLLSVLYYLQDRAKNITSTQWPLWSGTWQPLLTVSYLVSFWTHK